MWAQFWLLLFLAPPSRVRALPCVLTVPSLGLSFNLSALGTVRVDAEGFSYVANACRAPALSPRERECEAPALHGALAYQVHTGMRGECYALSDHGHLRAAGPLQGGGVGVEVALGGGTSCGERGRGLVIDVECGEGGGVSIAPFVACTFKMRVRSPAGCPLECARDGGGAVCGGAARGACALRDGGAHCLCVGSHSGPACDDKPLGGGALLPASVPPAAAAGSALLAASAGALAVAVALLARQWWRRGGADGDGSSSPSGPTFFPWAPLGAAVALLLLLALFAAGGPAGGIAGIHAAVTAPLQMWALVAGDDPRTPSSASPSPLPPPLLVVYGDIPLYWGNYAVKHFVVTANALKEEKGWEEYVPTVNDPRDSWEFMEARMLREFGRLPDVLLLLSDVGLTGMRSRYENFTRSGFFAKTQVLDWFDDFPRGAGRDNELRLRGVSVMMPTYEYLVENRAPATAGTPRVWMPHSALPAFYAQPLHPAPAPVVLLVGATMDGYPLRMEVKARIDHGDKRFVQWAHPGWTAGPSMQHIDDFAAAIRNHLACILDGSANNFVVAKVFEVPATGSLLLMSDDVIDALAALGLRSGEHYLSYNRSSLDATADWVLDPSNRPAVDRMRAAGRALAVARHTTRHRVDAIHAVGEMAARVQREKGGVWDAASLAAVTSFPAYRDWPWKNPASARYYSEAATYRRAQIVEEAEAEVLEHAR